MRAEVQVEGTADDIDLLPYAIRAERNGGTSLLSSDVRDSQEFVRFLQALISHGLHITHAQLHG
ncbi:hypothetical protein GCM10022399_28660 [Terrabacter ginsenosidimutans]|jgi:hypothetical protein|uniref:Uncharacterized protein n=1 Tax=Terrabacter ginsenosidimutans TaxID=490575 RepID=A0ABP7DWH0_9MICO